MEEFVTLFQWFWASVVYSSLFGYNTDLLEVSVLVVFFFLVVSSGVSSRPDFLPTLSTNFLFCFLSMYKRKHFHFSSNEIWWRGKIVDHFFFLELYILLAMSIFEFSGDGKLCLDLLHNCWQKWLDKKCDTFRNNRHPLYFFFTPSSINFHSYLFIWIAHFFWKLNFNFQHRRYLFV